MRKTEIITGIGTAISPIIHGEVTDVTPEEGRPGEKPQLKPKVKRTMPFYLKDSDGQQKLYQVPVISGNGLRGLGRRLLFDFTLDFLEIKIGDLVSKQIEARALLQFLRGGGLTAKSTSVLPVTPGTFAELRRKLPMLDLLGGVFKGHHFGGSCNVGILVPLTDETRRHLDSVMPEELEIELAEMLPDLLHSGEEGTNPVVKYGRMAEEEKNEEKEQMIYGSEVIPAGIKFFSYNTCTSENEGTLLAFKAMFALLQQHGYVGGMSSKGHGQMAFDFRLTNAAEWTDAHDPMNPSEALTAYASYLEGHKEDIIAALTSIPRVLQSQEPKPAKGTKTAKENTAAEELFPGGEE